MQKKDNRIEIGDKVSVSFHNSQFTICPLARVEYKPCAPGDSWIFRCLSTDDIHYVSEGCTITKKANDGK